MPVRNRTLKRHAREMRRSPTRAEDRIWSWLRGRRFGFKFRRQVPFGRYIVDFYCAELRLVIELDGSQHNAIWMSEYDDQRSAFLARHGLRVLRISNVQLIRDANMVEEQIHWAIRQITGTPPPATNLPSETLLPRRAGETVNDQTRQIAGASPLATHLPSETLLPRRAGEKVPKADEGEGSREDEDRCLP